MTPESLNALKELVETARGHHRGAWTARKTLHAYEVRDANGDIVADVARSVDFIAACDPETVLELVQAAKERDALRARLEEERGDNDGLREHIDMLNHRLEMADRRHEEDLAWKQRAEQAESLAEAFKEDAWKYRDLCK